MSDANLKPGFDDFEVLYRSRMERVLHGMLKVPPEGTERLIVRAPAPGSCLGHHFGGKMPFQRGRRRLPFSEPQADGAERLDPFCRIAS